MTDENARRTVVVTGASSGIGRAIALRLGRAGYTVFAGVRSPAAADELRAEGIASLVPLQLDVSDAESIERAFQQVRAHVAAGQPLHAVINNAAICVTGPLETVPVSALQEQFTVNLFGGVAVTQAALPLLLESKGRIVNIGSNVGRVPSPFLGPYAATKAALEALSDAWRRELREFGVQVSMVVPGPVMTPVWDKIDHSAREHIAQAGAAVRARYEARLDKFLHMNKQTAVRSKTSAEDVAEVVLRCLAEASPSHRYEIGPEARMATVLSRAVPSSWIDRLIHELLRPRGASTSLGRPLGGLERMYYYFNHWSSNNVVAVCELDGLIDPELIERALPHTLARHPLLQLRVEAGPGGAQPRFVPRTGEGELLRLETWPALDSRALIVREMNARIDPHSALIRVVYARDRQRSVLVVSLLHIIADAKSAMLVLRDLLDRAASKPAPAAAELPVVVPASPEDRLPAAMRGVAGIPAIARNQLSDVWHDLREKPARLLAEAELPYEARQNGYAHRQLEPAALTAIRQACRAHDVTVHGLLTAALALALADELGLRNSARSMLNIGSPVNLRDAYEPPVGDELGSYVCTLGLHLNVGRDEDCWSIARQVNRELAERSARSEAIAALALVGHASPTSTQASAGAVRLVERRGPGNVCISNLGEFDFPKRVLGVEVQAAHWTAPLSVTGYFLCAVCTTACGLSLDFAYLEEIVSRARAERIVSRMLSELSAATARTDDSRTVRLSPAELGS